MAASKEVRQKIIEEYRRNEGDSGSAEVQVALLTEDIKLLTAHMKTHPKDYLSRRGLLQKVSLRNKLLGYLNRSAHQRYIDLIQKLGLRR